MGLQNPTSMPCLFAIGSSRELGSAVAFLSGIQLGELEEREFEDGEHKIRPLTEVRDREVYVFHSLHGEPGQSPNDKLCRLLFLVGALKDAWARSVTVLVPYLCYSRKDRRTKSQDPVTCRYVAGMMESAGGGRVVTMDVHNLAAFENAFRCPMANLELRPLLVDYVCSLEPERPLCVVSPDAGGLKRTEAFRLDLQERLKTSVGRGFVEKFRSEGRVWGSQLIGEVEGRDVIILDDLIASGTTLIRAAEACRKGGAVRVVAAATHGLFSSASNEVLKAPCLDQILVSDTVPPLNVLPGALKEKLTILSTAPMWAGLLKGLAPSCFGSFEGSVRSS